jgi:hypothetical protein
LQATMDTDTGSTMPTRDGFGPERNAEFAIPRKSMSTD